MKTMNKFIVNGNEVNAYYSSNDINDVLIPLLQRWVHLYETKKRRVIVYLQLVQEVEKALWLCFWKSYLNH